MTDTLPPLPAIVQRADAHYSGEGLADAVRAYALAVVQAERERCAKICDNIDAMAADLMVSRGSALECAAAIRAG
jgi:hypothetical protein